MIVELVRKEPNIFMDRIESVIAWKTGLTSRKISEYVKILVRAGQLEENKGRFRIPEG